MEVATLGEGFRSSDGQEDKNTSNNPWTGGRRPSTRTEPAVISKTSFSLYKLVIVLVLATTFPGAISANANFSLDGSSYKCGSNLICLGHAHEYPGSNATRIQDPRLSLIWERSSGQRPNVGSGIAYYNQPVRFKDPFTNQSASFSTNFSMDVVMVHYPKHGDGMTFVISADNKTLGEERLFLGIFDVSGITTFKSVVVEFDLYKDRGNSPVTHDINDNHVSFDFSNITTTVAANASNVGVELWNNTTTYAWVDYSDETHQLEVRVSNNSSRPTSPLLKHRLNLSDVVEEYMWVGFSAGSGDYYSYYYIGDWSFQSSGIASYSSPVRARLRNKLDGLTIGIVVGAPVLLVACILVLLHRNRSRDGWIELKLTEEPTEQLELVRVFRYQELSNATNDFDSKNNKLGGGAFGDVYRGMLPSPSMVSDTPVAVKEIRRDSVQGETEFMAEVSIISQVRHRNLIELIGCCKACRRDDASQVKYLIVYELMSNGSLDKWLFPDAPPAEQQTTALSWPQRFDILTGTAAGIDYLHQGWNSKQQVIHKDIKSSNIMLDDEMNPKLGDFGFALLVDHRSEAFSTVLAGTFGYLAPELYTRITLGFNSGRFTDKTDVYAFGVVVLEVACGRKAVLGPQELLVDWVWHRYCNGDENGDLLSTVDERLDNNYDPRWMKVLLKVGLICCHVNPSARPTMSEVVQILAVRDPGEVPSNIFANIPTSRPVHVSRPLPDCNLDSVTSLSHRAPNLEELRG